MNIFNLNNRQQQAGAERAFIEKRLADAQSQLSNAENNLQAFLTENRDFRSSPTLQLEFDRLNRTVASRQSLYNSLAASYEQGGLHNGGLALFVASGAAVFLNLKHVFDNDERRG